MQFYRQLRCNVEIEHSRMYAGVKKLADNVGSEEKMPRIIRGRQSRLNPEVTNPKDYWRVTLTIPFLDSIIMELESRVAPDKRAHYDLCCLIPEVITKQSNNDLSQLVKYFLLNGHFFQQMTI